MLLRILLLLLALQLTDLYLLFVLSQSIGFWQTLMIVLGAGFLGSSLARREGLRVWQGWQGAMQAEQLPEEGIVDGMLVFLGGGLLIAPGLLTDAVGLILLVPVSRRLLARLVRGWLQRQIESRSLAVMSGADFAGRPSSAGQAEPLAGSSGGVIDTTGVESPEAPDDGGGSAPSAPLARHVAPSRGAPGAGRPGKH